MEAVSTVMHIGSVKYHRSQKCTFPRTHALCNLE
jgi:hypothetical protein